jgi:hypothetical protein
MMCNFFLMFFYEAALEVSISLIIGVNYLEEYAAAPENEQYATNNSRNLNTRDVHRILLYVFFVL